MNRRKVLSAVTGVGFVGLAGCASSDSPEEPDSGNGNNDNAGGQNEEEYETGIVFEGNLGELRNWNVDVVQGQTVTVEASDIDEGERLWFQVGDGTGFVHSYRFYEENDGDTNEYEIESDGQHQLQLNAERHEVPMNEDVEIYARMELNKP